MARIIPVRPPIQAARPTVSGVGTVNGGASEFLFHDDFSSGDNTHTENGIGWTGTHNTLVLPYANPSGSGYALRFRNNDPDNDGVPGGDGSSHGEQRFDLDLNDLGTIYEELWVKFNLYIPEGLYLEDVGASDNNKMFRLWSGDQTDGNSGYSNYYIKGGSSFDIGGGGGSNISMRVEHGTLTSASNQVGQHGTALVNNVITSADHGNIVEYVIHMKVDTLGAPGDGTFDDTGGNGIFEIWKNGTLLRSHTTIRARPSSGTNGYNRGYFLGATNTDWGNPPGSEVVDFWMTEVWIAETNVFGVSSNEPAGAVKVTDRQFVSLDEDGWNDSDGEGTDAATLSMADGVLTALFPAGHPGTGSSSRCTTSDYGGWSGTEAVYIHIQIRYSANWYGQDGSGVNKILYIGDEATNPVVLDAHGSGSGTLRLRVATQGGETVNFDWDDASTGELNEVSPSAADAEIPRGEWVDIELLLEPNTPGSSNGTIHAWVNGVKTQQYSNRPIYAPGTNLANQRWHVHPIYGGGGGNPIPADQTLEYRMLYLSTVN